VTERVDGVADTPVGSPLSEIVTGSANPFTAEVVTVKDRADPPLCNETEAGAAVMLKSATSAGEMARLAVVECESESAAPVTVIVALPFVADPVGAAESEAESMNWPN